MPGPLLHIGAGVACIHLGQATPMATNPRVRVSGLAIVTAPSTYQITGCTLPSNAGGPDLSAAWVTGAARVRANGLPVLLADSQNLCTPTATHLIVTTVQPRVIGM